MDNEKVSVIMAIYNCAPYLREAIESILNQTYTDWELILCDDASTDGTYAIAQRYAEQYPDKIILIRNEQNMKLSYSLNHCLEYAKGKYVARMDGDDKCLPERFEKQIAYLKAHPEYDLVGTSMQRFDENGLGKIYPAVDEPDRVSMKRSIPFHHATIMTYKYVYDQLEGYCTLPRAERVEDYDLWFRFFHAGFHGNSLKEPLYIVREDNNVFQRRKRKYRINGIKTTIYGFQLLNYPKTLMIRSVGVSLLKCCVPNAVYYLYKKRKIRTSGNT